MVSIEMRHSIAAAADVAGKSPYVCMPASATISANDQYGMAGNIGYSCDPNSFEESSRNDPVRPFMFGRYRVYGFFKHGGYRALFDFDAKGTYPVGS